MLKIEVSEEQFESITQGLLNNVIATEEWNPDKGLLFLKCGEDQVISDVLECENVGQGRWLIIFQPIVPGPVPQYKTETPVSNALKEVSEKPKRPKRPMNEFLKKMTKPWHGYYV